MTINADEIYQLIYQSRCGLAGSVSYLASETDLILDKSEFNNARDEITGALIFSSSIFIQILEGRCKQLEQTFERICCDVRHTGVEVVSLAPVSQRVFSGWRMRRVQVDESIGQQLSQLGDTTNKADRKFVDAISQAVDLMMKSAADVQSEH